MTDRPHAKPLPEDQHLFEPPPPIELPPPTPVLVKGDITVRLDFEADVAALARKFPAEFESCANRKGYQPWEQGSVFLWELVNEHLEVFLAEIKEGLWDRTSFGDPDIDYRWTPEQATLLNESLGIVDE